VPTNLAYAATLSGLLSDTPVWLQALAFLGLCVGGPSLSALYLLVIVSCARSITLPSVALAGGRNSLSGYVTDGIIAGFVFGGYGLGLFGQLGHAALLGIAIAIALSGLALAALWDVANPRGPLELVLKWFVTEPKSRRADGSKP
jgi:uncharacterized protein